MIATKAQELEALKKIKKIVEDLGENSYIGMAFDGCFEIAEENIKNDFGESMKRRVESANNEAEHFRKLAGEQLAEIERLNKENDALKTRTLLAEDVVRIEGCINEVISIARANEKDSAKTIVELADNPGEQSFIEAVKMNRRSKKKLNALNKILEKVSKMA